MSRVFRDLHDKVETDFDNLSPEELAEYHDWVYTSERDAYFRNKQLSGEKNDSIETK